MRQEEEFFAEGLRFHCTRCSMCCRFDSGYVFLSQRDIERIADGLHTGESEVRETYCRRVQLGPVSRLSLKEQPNKDCVFWMDGECSIYEHRPLQCRSFPFWPANLGSRSRWDDLERECPGVNIGRRHSAREIRQLLAAHRRDALL
ncbi:MAG: YkgJ family cysteine cluster protein [Spirochaetaceae bacterium]